MRKLMGDVLSSAPSLLRGGGGQSSFVGVCTEVALAVLMWCGEKLPSRTQGIGLGRETLVLQIPTLPLSEEAGAGQTLWLSPSSAWLLERECSLCSPALSTLIVFLYRFTLSLCSVSFIHWNDPLLLNGKNILHPGDLGKNSLSLWGREHLA